MSAWVIWLIAAGVLAGAEVLSTDLVLIMLAGGALGGCAAALVGLPVALQAIVAVMVGTILLLGVRPVATRHLLRHGVQRTNADALVGKKAVVLQSVDGHGGRVRLNGAEWSARSVDEHRVIEVGKTVEVIEISGATAVVWDGP
jgi:membrane protein implicated in regulation of membrane protease activity